MYFGDKIALEELKNYSICVRTDKGIRNIDSEQDALIENLVFVGNIPTIYEDRQGEVMTIKKGEMVRYRSVVLILR